MVFGFKVIKLHNVYNLQAYLYNLITSKLQTVYFKE